MERFIAIDSGKFATKVAEYNVMTDSVKRYSIRTKMSEGNFLDDALEKSTYIVEIDGEVYKVGNGARGSGVELTTDKKTDTHRMCVLTVLAMFASSSEVDTINVAVGLPTEEWANAVKRAEFKNFILPDGEVSVKIKKDSVSEPVVKKFKIGRKYVFPESIGALFCDELYDEIEPTTITGVIDIGNLNLNATYWQGTELVQDKSVTEELGGAILIQELSQALEDKICPCDEMVTANILKSEDKKLPAGFGITNEQVEQSAVIVKDILKKHAQEVRRFCDKKKWPLSVMRVVAIGGTSKDIEAELKEAFSNITVLSTPEYCNVNGFLRILCAQDPSLGVEISLSGKPKDASKDNGAEKTSKEDDKKDSKLKAS